MHTTLLMGDKVSQQQKVRANSVCVVATIPSCDHCMRATGVQQSRQQGSLCPRLPNSTQFTYLAAGAPR